jgi:hypothetical protein
MCSVVYLYAQCHHKFMKDKPKDKFAEQADSNRFKMVSDLSMPPLKRYNLYKFISSFRRSKINMELNSSRTHWLHIYPKLEILCQWNYHNTKMLQSEMRKQNFPARQSCLKCHTRSSNICVWHYGSIQEANLLHALPQFNFISFSLLIKKIKPLQWRHSKI